MIAGYDSPPNGDGPALYYCDYLGTLSKMTFAAEGYAQYFVLSTLDRHWKKNLSVEGGLEVLRKCIAEVQKRLVINQPRFVIKMVSKEGITVLDDAGVVSSSDIDMKSAPAPATVPASSS